MKLKPKQFLIYGFLLVTYGMVIPWLMVLGVIKSTFFLAFTSYAASFVGVIFGVVGVVTYYREHRRGG